MIRLKDLLMEARRHANTSHEIVALLKGLGFRKAAGYEDWDEWTKSLRDRTAAWASKGSGRFSEKIIVEVGGDEWTLRRQHGGKTESASFLKSGKGVGTLKQAIKHHFEI